MGGGGLHKELLEGGVDDHHEFLFFDFKIACTQNETQTISQKDGQVDGHHGFDEEWRWPMIMIINVDGDLLA